MSKANKYILAAIILTNAGCSIENPRTGGVALTFDDSSSIPSWHTASSVFIEYGVRATFYVDKPQILDDGIFKILQDLQDQGHEIGFHGTNHRNAVDYVYFNRNSVADYVAYEILPGLTFLSENGIDVMNFAYPFGYHSSEGV